MDNISNLGKFNLTIINLADDLINLFPEKNYLQIFKNKFEILIKYNPRLSYKLFKSEVYIFKEQIINKNSDFFLKKNYNETLDNYDINSNWTLDKVLDIKNLWENLSEENKETIWLYFNVLIKISEII